MKLSLTHLAQIAEVIAAVAVVVSLIYVGREVQSNTDAIRGAAMHAVAASDAGVLMTVAGDSALSRIMQLGQEDASQLNEAEAFRFYLFQRQFWLSFQNIYQQSELGLIDPSVWQGYLTIICAQMNRPGVHGTWPDHRDVLDPAFAEVVESCGTDA